MAFLGPDTPSLGEVGTEGQLYQNQIAQTVSKLLGYKWGASKSVGQSKSIFISSMQKHSIELLNILNDSTKTQLAPHFLMHSET